MTAFGKILCLAPVLALLVLAGCSSAPTVPEQRAAAPVSQLPATVGDRAAAIAMDQRGIPYVYGGSTPSNGFDCSGLVQYAYSQAGKAVPRTSRAQYSAARRIDIDKAQPGDLLFFASSRNVDHVGIYLGNGEFVHAPKRGRTVETAKLSDAWYQQTFVSAGRL